jgi:hypothetical protein
LARNCSVLIFRYAIEKYKFHISSLTIKSSVSLTDTKQKDVWGVNS